MYLCPTPAWPILDWRKSVDVAGWWSGRQREHEGRILEKLFLHRNCVYILHNNPERDVKITALVFTWGLYGLDLSPLSLKWYAASAKTNNPLKPLKIWGIENNNPSEFAKCLFSDLIEHVKNQGRILFTLPQATLWHPSLTLERELAFLISFTICLVYIFIATCQKLIMSAGNNASKMHCFNWSPVLQLDWEDDSLWLYPSKLWQMKSVFYNMSGLPVTSSSRVETWFDFISVCSLNWKWMQWPINKSGIETAKKNPYNHARFLQCFKWCP